MALRCVDRFRPQILLLDIGQPDMDGLELIRRLRQLPVTAAALHIALSGQGSVQARRKSLAAGCDHHLVKPCSLVEIDAHSDGEGRGSEFVVRLPTGWRRFAYLRRGTLTSDQIAMDSGGR